MNYLQQLTLLLFLLPNNVYAESIVLKKGDIAPSSGLFFNQKDAQTVQNNLQDYKLQLQIVKQLNLQINLLTINNADDEKRIQLVSDQNDKLAKDDNSNRALSTIEKAFYFIAGTAVMYGAVRLGQTIH